MRKSKPEEKVFIDGYNMSYICQNCGKTLILAIKKGARAENVLTGSCEYCGCNTNFKVAYYQN